jgi:hypothetical protein
MWQVFKSPTELKLLPDSAPRALMPKTLYIELPGVELIPTSLRGSRSAGD